MTWTKRCPLAVAAIATMFCAAIAETSFAGNSTIRLISMQDDTRRLPSENIVWFSAKNPKLLLKLELLAKRGANATAGTVVTVVDDLGRSRDFTADENGVVAIDKIHEGLYGIVAFNAQSHASTVFALRETELESTSGDSLIEDAAGEDPAKGIAAATARLTMVTAMSEKLVPIVTGSLNAETNAPSSAVDPSIVANTLGLSPFDYRVHLGTGGVLRGQLITVIRPSSRFSAVKGTRVTVTKNGIPIGTATANALGQFQIGGLRAGVHGLIVAGRGGYAAFAFEAINGENIAGRQPLRLVSSRLQFDGTILPVAMVPPTMIPAVLTAIQDYFPRWRSMQSTHSPPSSRPSVIKITDDQVVMNKINDGYSGALAANHSPHNPLRSQRASRTVSRGSLGNSNAMSALSVLAGAAAFVVPVAVDDDAPGVVSTNAGL